MPEHLYPIPPAVSILPLVPSPSPRLARAGPHLHAGPNPNGSWLKCGLLLGVTPLEMTVSPLGWPVSKARACCILIGLCRQMPFTTHWDGRGPVPSSRFWFYLRFTTLPVLCAKHITWNAVFAHLNLTSCEWNVTAPFIPVRKIFKSNISRRLMGPLQGKVIGDSSPLDWNSKTRKSRTIQGEGWALPTAHISHSQSQETSPTRHEQKRLVGSQTGVMSRDVLPRRLFGKIHLG